jgi:hypothetical protein
MSPGLKSVRAPDTVRPIPSAHILPVDIERIATVRIVANFFMIYLFFLFGARLTAGRRQDYLMRIFEESVELTKVQKKFK